MDVLKLMQDPIWTFIAVIIAVIGLAITIVVSFRQRSIKKIVFSIISDAPIASIKRGVEDIGGEVEVYYKTKDGSKLIKDAHLLLIDIWNAGTKEIKKEDFEENIGFDFGISANILTTAILETTPPEVKGTVFIENEMNDLILKPLLLNKGDKVRLQVLADGYQAGSLKAKSRIAGVDQIKEVVKKENQENPEINKDLRFSLAIIMIWFMIFITITFFMELILAAINALFGIDLFNVINSNSYNSIVSSAIIIVSVGLTAIIFRIWGKALRSNMK